MAVIVLNKKERFFLSDKFYLILQGKVCVHDIFENGKSLPREACFKKGELVGNFFLYFPRKDLCLPDPEVEIVALEDNTIIEEFKFSPKDIVTNLRLEKIILQLIKENAFKIFANLYDTKGYILAILRFYADENGILSKDFIHYENFSISKSQFYSLYNNLKKDEFFIENGKKVRLNLEKINSYLTIN